MNLLQLFQGSKQVGSKVLFNEAAFSINTEEHVGLIGANGAGKTTLFKIIAGIEELDSGVLTRSQQLNLGYLRQESDWNVEQNVEDFLMEKNPTPIWEIKSWGAELGLTEEIYSRQMKTLSGGFRMRVQLQKLISQRPNLLLLDEPTNFLDLETTLILERFLQGYKGAFLLISHDREFLRRTTDHTMEIDNQEVTKFPGNIDDYFDQKAQLEIILKAQVRNQELRRKEIQEFVDRFRAKASKAKQAQSRMKMLDKMEVIETKALPVRAQIPLPIPTKTGKETLQLENLSVGFPDKIILSQINLRLNRGDHLAVVGVNGAGKSTLLKTLSGKLSPRAGELKWGYQVGVSYFAQFSTDELRAQETVVEALSRAAHREVTLQEVKNLAGALLFGGDDINKKVAVLSGGEKSRVALGQVLLQKNPVLLLDEPTNHLDFDTVEALTQALQRYEGTLVFVSHDRGFVRRLGTKILEIREGRAEYYPGSYDDYVWRQEQLLKLSDSEAAPIKSRSASEKTPHPPLDANARVFQREHLKKLEADLKKLIKEEKKEEQALENLNRNREELIQESIQSQGSVVADLIKQISDIEKEIIKLETNLMSLMEKRDQVERELLEFKKPKN
jgi:ATP-binding cassette subfamily F protein 3